MRSTRPQTRAASQRSTAGSAPTATSDHVSQGATALKPETGKNVVQCTEGQIPHISDPNVSFTIPNEIQYRAEKQKEKEAVIPATRKNGVRGDGEPVMMENMLDKPPGLQWKGNRTITTGQLQVQAA
ncbi:hypothetical protein OPV22_026623 [Ensete ventricosum]|uniref:Uncharacterized protein n=1 Tax=Ensete ventricosum TaxID=4639 RepID=A0AAV8QKE5_ENSVE|nr:hypothetical protein OPV22_026623 [Ensete ventricosum]